MGSEFLQLAGASATGLRPTGCETLQINVGKLCNQACLHCHVEAGPHRTEIMSGPVAEKILAWLAQMDIPTVDITGGAPEMTPCFRRLVTRARELGRAVIVRHNLTVQAVTGQADLPDFFRQQQIHVIASLPCYLEENVDRQRGGGVYAGSIAGLQALNAVGYGQSGSGLRLDLVYNPLGPELPPAQEALQADYTAYLHDRFGIVFNRLLTMTNVPINRFRHQLERDGQLLAYQHLLRDRFNPAALSSLMCRNLVSVDWQGFVYDCDFNQMLELRIGNGRAARIWELKLSELLTRRIITADHCFACTAGSGSSCGGTLA